jgi:hypothetical protein
MPVVSAVLSSYAATYPITIQIPASMADGDYSAAGVSASSRTY